MRNGPRAFSEGLEPGPRFLVQTSHPPNPQSRTPPHINTGSSDSEVDAEEVLNGEGKRCRETSVPVPPAFCQLNEKPATLTRQSIYFFYFRRIFGGVCCLLIWNQPQRQCTIPGFDLKPEEATNKTTQKPSTVAPGIKQQECNKRRRRSTFP